jgi:hypothetical protein
MVPGELLGLDEAAALKVLGLLGLTRFPCLTMRENMVKQCKTM